MNIQKLYPVGRSVPARNVRMSPVEVGRVTPCAPPCLCWSRFGNWCRRSSLLLLATLCLAAPAAIAADVVADPMPPAAILQQLKSFETMGTVLYVAAHPDDENTLLIAYFARGRNYRTAYLSLTRGDGGQNVLGPEFGPELGVARTQELLAARRVDGGRQFFSRAVDFGFSKDYRETLTFWDREAVVADIVRVIREFRPDVIITRFSTVPGGTHGHHTASAVLALEAFRLAGRADAFPDQLGTLQPWHPRRILWNGRGGDEAGGNSVHVEVDGTDPVTGMSFGELAGRSRSMHKTQGFGNFGGGGGGRRSESFQLLDGDPARNDIMDGIDTTWNRVPGGAAIGAAVDAIIAHFDTNAPSSSVAALLKLRGLVADLKSTDPVVIEKAAQLDRILQACLGLTTTTTIANAEVVPGEAMTLHTTMKETASVPVRWLGTRNPKLGEDLTAVAAIALTPNEIASHDETVILPASTPISQPYWLQLEGTVGMSKVEDPDLIGRPENPPVFPIEQVFEVDGQKLVVPDEPVQVTSDLRPEHVRGVRAIPPASLHFSDAVKLFKPGEARTVDVEITGNRPGVTGSLAITVSPDWKVQPASQDFTIAAAGERKTMQFTVTAPGQDAEAKMVAVATIGGAHYDNDRVEINYRHIPFQLLQPVASSKAVSLDLQIRGQNIGYLPGAGDSVADGLKQMGYNVTMLSDADLTPEKLHGLDAVVIGVRAFNVRTGLGAQLPALFDYVKAGGTVVAQYNRPDGLRATPLAPYDLKIANLRITDETAAMTFLAPDSPVLNTPNKITQADFNGWVQERGIYFPSEWDDHFTPILAAHDPNEEPLKGSLLVAQYGKGYYVYTGLVFFRQLPAGVPGAYRLMANLVSLGK